MFTPGGGSSGGSVAISDGKIAATIAISWLTADVSSPWRASNDGGRARSGGATLLEVLVAFIILAGAVLVSFPRFRGWGSRLHAAEERGRIVAIARRELALLDAAQSLRAGTVAGEDVGGISWSITIKPHEWLRDTARNAVVPFDVSIRVGDRPGEAAVALETVLLAVSEP